MRVLAALVVLASFVALAEEPCAKSGLLLFPAPGAVVPTNVQLILEGTGEAQATVQALLANKAIALIADGVEPIQVKAEKGFISQMNRVAIRLRPLKSLEPNTEYTLILPAELAGTALLNDQLGDGSLRWLTGGGADKKAPKYKEKPASSEGFYGKDKAGGLVRRLKLRTLVDESSPAWVLVTMERARGGSTRQQYPVAVTGDGITLGHDGCSGNFGFDDGRAYRLSFELFDAAGNKGTEKHKLEITAPRPLD
ncbi:MAG TPA: hypothetical protein VGE37_07100 [Archangium sp.]